MNRQRILITGGGGFVGSHLAIGFTRLGHEVIASDRSFDAATRHRLAGVRLVEASLTSSTLAKLVGPVDIVLHGAAITSSPQDAGLSEAGHIKCNLDLLLDTLDGAVAIGARQFVFLSSSGVFAINDADDILTEQIVPTGTSAYALAKRAGEIIVNGIGAGDFSTYVVRLGYLYGAFETVRPSRLGISLVRRWLEDARAGSAIRVETPSARRDWTYVGDLAPALDALLASMEADGAPMHLGSGAIHTDRELAEAILRVVPAAAAPVFGNDRASLKAPMGSIRADRLKGFGWTPLEEGLSALANEELAA